MFLVVTSINPWQVMWYLDKIIALIKKKTTAISVLCGHNSVANSVACSSLMLTGIMWLCLALSPRYSGWLGQSSRSLLPLFPSPYVSSPFSAACIGRAARGVYPEVDHLSCQGGLIKGLDVQLWCLWGMENGFLLWCGFFISPVSLQMLFFCVNFWESDTEQ